MRKVIDIEERIPSMREKRRRKTNKKFILILSIFVLALLILLYFQSPYSRINKVTITGADLYDKEFYMQESEIIKDKPLWGFSIQAVEKSLAKIDTVKNVSISRKWLHDVTITLTEWDTIAYIEEEGDFSLLLESGDIFSAEDLLPNEKVPILNGFTSADSRKRITAQLVDIEKDVYQLISEIIVKDTKNGSNDITVYMDDGYEVRAIISTFADNMAYYPEITAQLHEHEKGVIDMEVGTFFTPYSKVYGLNEENDEDADESE